MVCTDIIPHIQWKEYLDLLLIEPRNPEPGDTEGHVFQRLSHIELSVLFCGIN